MSLSNIVIMSIKPKWAKDILLGEKKVEFRRSFSKELRKDFTIVIYASAPISGIVGVAKVKSLETGCIYELWDRLGMNSGASQREFFDYFCNKKNGVALHIVEPKISKCINLSLLREQCDFSPPVSWRYLKESEFNFLKGRLL